ncbi:hypothetical protein AB1Y20_008809 [Prymnesium parvum]|uniref:Distal membrane arm assembly complex 2-like protein n=1 Tax=Prymnesium parvum TaxID=97485 RepID=A0AB34IUF7_PRYPA
MAAGVEGEAPPPPHPLCASLTDPELKALLTGTDVCADFEAVCAKLGLRPPPRVATALRAMAEQLAQTRSFAMKRWACDAATLCALLVSLSTHRVGTVKFCGCAIAPAELLLLKLGLPPSVSALLVDGAEPSDTPTRFAPLLALPPSVCVLSLKSCCIGGAELEQLLPLLAANPALTALSLWGNPLGDGGARAIAASLGSLRALNLGNTLLGSRGAQALGRAIGANTSLTSLNLSHNRVGRALGEAMLQGLAVNNTLCLLDLRRNALPEETQALLREEASRSDSGRVKPLEIGL